MPKALPARPRSRAYDINMRGSRPIPQQMRRPVVRRRIPASVGELAKAVVAVEAARPLPAPVKTPVPARYMPPIDMDLPGNESPLRHLDSLLRYGKLAAIRRWTFRGAVAAIALVLIVGGFLFSQGFFNLNKSFKGSAAALKTNVNPDLLKGEGDGRINVLLLGRGGGNHDGPDLTDTMMIDSIDPVNHTSTLISIPRDLWVDVPNQGAMKINSAFESGEFKYLGKTAPGSTNPNAIQAGFDEADQTVESVLGVTIHYNVLVSFQAFQQAVDTVGGVAVNVPSDLVDPTMAWENGNNPVLAKAGNDAFNGKQALNYVRSRETTSDFARGQRQRAVLVALKNKVATAGTLSNPFKVSQLVKAFGDNVHTDLSIKDAMRLYSIVKAIPDSKTNSIGLSDAPNNYVTTGTLAGQSIALPTAGLFNYGDIQMYIRTQLKDPYILKENARISLLNGTQIADLAGTKANELKTYGYNVVSTGNAPNANYIQTTVVDLTHGKDKYTKHYLEQRFGVTATTRLPDNTIQTNGADFVIILGSDEAPPSQN
ncbi:MAG TPA: LCP family protein [Candidatus Saccharimonadales bacterium]|nr:LCP family protein [Candidatus Saccharimonadales bacterium]